MQLRSRVYPYPVIVEGGDYYQNSEFTSSVEQSLEGFNIMLTLKAELIDEKMSGMIKSGELLFAHHIECPQTCYRRVVKTRDAMTEVLIQDAEVNGIVQVCSFIVADKDFDKYTNDSFAPDYQGWKFNIEKGCIMAVGNQFNLRINKIRDDLANTSSIFSIVKNTDQTVDTVSVDLGQQKIIIMLPDTTYNQYSSVQNYIDIQPVMHSMIIVPALIFALSELRRAGEQIFEYEENRWFRGLRKACAAINVPLDEEGLKRIDIVKVPQLLLNSPIFKGFDYIALGGGIYED